MNILTSPYTPVVLAGGIGSRLWPLSRAAFPKQFLKIGSQQSLLQETLLRFANASTSPAVVVCSEKHRFLAAEQLSSIGHHDATIILEPASRSTAPAIALAAWHSLRQNSDAVMIVMPADHKITDHIYFKSIVEQAGVLACEGQLVTLGISPTHPETGYGYITVEAGTTTNGAHSVKHFVEKPEQAKAEQLIAQGNCYWNAGIFVFRAATFLESLKALQPEIHRLTELAMSGAECDLDFLRVNTEAFEQCDDISVDYAVMEQASNVVVLPFESQWSDIGSWDAVHNATKKDRSNNASVGDAIHQDCENTYLHSSSRLVVAVGARNLSVIETADAVLVIDHSNAQSIKKTIEKLKTEGRPELTTHTTCYRPWGHYETLKLHPRFQVKQISVKPGAKLSLQKHFHRSEHWIVVKGTAIVTKGDQQCLVSENESIYIPLGTIHRLENPGTIALELIEVQSGSYLGEDDIVRLSDDYSRVQS